MTTCIRRPFSRWVTCPCEDCTTDRNRTAKLARCGLLERVPSVDAWERIDKWRGNGYEPAWIASACGIPIRGIQTAIREYDRTGHRRDFGHTYSAAIVNANIDTATAGRRDATGTRRRLQALAVNGWTVEELGRQMGVSFVTLAAYQRGESRHIHARLWHAITDGYERLEYRSGPSKEATRRALARGWHRPAMWDDPETDAEPQRAGGRRPAAALLEDFAFLTRAGESEEQALARLGVTKSAIEIARKRTRKEAA